jgi:hypothetical protein
MRYFQVVSGVLDQAIEQYCRSRGITATVANQHIAQHILKTSNQHYSGLDPDIDYDEPLCRLGYMFMHAGANAYLFETAIRRSLTLQRIIGTCSDQLAVCAVGGGPGTEVMGLCKYLGDAGTAPASVWFTVLDRVQEWVDTWMLLANATGGWLNQRFGRRIPLAPQFHQMDVTDSASYDKLAFLFQTFDMFVFNYLLSENKVRLGGFVPALRTMVAQARPGAAFVFIDRSEADPKFRDDVRATAQASGLRDIETFSIGGSMDDHPEADLGDYPAHFRRRPRRWFRHSQTLREEVFVLIGVRP